MFPCYGGRRRTIHVHVTALAGGGGPGRQPKPTWEQLCRGESILTDLQSSLTPLGKSFEQIRSHSTSQQTFLLAFSSASLKIWGCIYQAHRMHLRESAPSRPFDFLESQMKSNKMRVASICIVRAYKLSTPNCTKYYRSITSSPTHRLC